MNLTTNAFTWIVISLILAILIMLALYRSQLRAFPSRTPRFPSPGFSNKPPVDSKTSPRHYNSGILADVIQLLEKKQNPPEVTNNPLPTAKQSVSPKTLTSQSFDAFLVLDFEGTCEEGSAFDYPNEVIEFPVVLMHWKDKTVSGKASELLVVDEFRSFVRPIWRPKLSKFCTELTGITQAQVDGAPDFIEVLTNLRAFLVENGLINKSDGKAAKRFCWCTDGPWDLGDLLTKQCFHSRIQPPNWLQNNIIDVRHLVKTWMEEKEGKSRGRRWTGPNIQRQLRELDLEFEGRLHSGIDDTRNIARVVAELARRGVKLQPNATVTPRKRFAWMGKAGRIREEHIVMMGKR